jgi:hypothetical protein
MPSGTTIYSAYAPCQSVSVYTTDGELRDTYTISKSKDFITLLELLSGLAELGDYSREFDTHDRLGSLWGKGVFTLPLHDVHSVQAEVLKSVTVSQKLPGLL